MGRVLILGTWNYSLLLVGAQAAQALAGGNRVSIKPAIGSEAATSRMVQAFHEAGVPQDQLEQLDSSTETAIAAIDEGVDLIVLTGAASTGRKVLQRAAESLTPTIMELSGCDAVVLMPGTDLEKAADAIDFGLKFNGGATCVSPRRLIIEESMATTLAGLLQSRLESAESATVHPSARQAAANTIEIALQQGAVDCLGRFQGERLRADGTLHPMLLDHVKPEHDIASTDLFAPVTSLIRVNRIEDAVGVVNRCPYRLAASVFGPLDGASSMARRLQVGSVVVNDVLVPLADPRIPFGGRGESGFGVTRGTEGLLAMTHPRVYCTRRGGLQMHLRPRHPSDAQTLLGALQLLHGGSPRRRLKGLRRMVAAANESRKPEGDL